MHEYEFICGNLSVFIGEEHQQWHKIFRTEKDFKYYIHIMKIQASKELPSITELVEILQKEFKDKYSCKLFGLGKDKTIMLSSLLSLVHKLQSEEMR